MALVSHLHFLIPDWIVKIVASLSCLTEPQAFCKAVYGVSKTKFSRCQIFVYPSILIFIIVSNYLAITPEWMEFAARRVLSQ